MIHEPFKSHYHTLFEYSAAFISAVVVSEVHHCRSELWKNKRQKNMTKNSGFSQFVQMSLSTKQVCLKKITPNICLILKTQNYQIERNKEINHNVTFKCSFNADCHFSHPSHKQYHLVPDKLGTHSAQYFQKSFKQTSENSSLQYFINDKYLCQQNWL